MTSSTPGKPSVMDKIKDTVQKVTHTGAHSDPATTSHSNTHGAHTAGTHTTTGTGIGAHDTTGTGAGPGPAPTTAGPHTSDTMNKLDPRVDSDLSGSHTGMTGGSNYGTSTYGTSGAGLTSGSTTGTGYNTGAVTGSGYDTGVMTGSGYNTGATTGSGYNTGSTTVGPHSSDTMNKLDPRVDSDLSGARSGYGATGAGTTSSNMGTTGNSGYGSSGVTSMSSGPGPAPNTAGPHSSDMLNKMDPRVDSDLDGSKTIGQTNNPTY